MRYHRRIEYSPKDRDYALFLDDQLVGYARTNHEAEVALDQEVFSRMQSDNRDLAPAANLYATYKQNATAFWSVIAAFTNEQRSDYAVLFAVYATTALNVPTTPEKVLVRWAAGQTTKSV